MSVYLVSYDLRKPGQNYEPLTRELAKHGSRILLSDWIVEVTQTATQLLSAIKTYIDMNDRVVVVEITPAAEYAVRNGMAAGVRFLERHCP